MSGTDNGVTETGGVNAGNLAGTYVTFLVDGEVYGLAHGRVQEIMGLTDLVPLPQGPECIRGVITGRGSAVPAVDMRRRFGREPVPDSPHTCVIVVAAMDTRVGIIVDDVGEVIHLPESAIEASTGADGYVHGRGRHKGSETKLLAVDTLLKGEELAWLAEIQSTGARPR